MSDTPEQSAAEPIQEGARLVVDFPKPEVDNVEFGYDDGAGLYFARDLIGGQCVYVSDRKRLHLYTKGVLHRQRWLLGDYRIPLDLVRAGDFVVDVGANSGELGIWAQSHGAAYCGLDPDPNAFRALGKNVGEANAHQVAIGSINGRAEFYLSTEDADSSLFEPDVYQEKIIVKKKTLDSVLLSIGASESIRLLKIEAEGMEPEVLAGASEALCRAEYIAVDAGPERGGENTVPDVINTLTRFGFVVEGCFLFRGTFFLKNGRFKNGKRVGWSFSSWNFAGLLASGFYFLSRLRGIFSEKRRQKFLKFAQKRDARIKI